MRPGQEAAWGRLAVKKLKTEVRGGGAAGAAQPCPAPTMVIPMTGRLGQLLVGAAFPGESCEGWWSRQGEVLRTGGAR